MRKRLTDFLTRYKGVFFKKGGYLDYTEIHAWLKGFYKGLAVFRLKTLQKHLNAIYMDVDQYEESEGHYSDNGMIIGYVAKIGVLAHFLPVQTILEVVLSLPII